MPIPLTVQITIRTPTVAVNGGTGLKMALYDGQQRGACPIIYWVHDHGIGASFDHSKDPDLEARLWVSSVMLDSSPKEAHQSLSLL